MFRDFHKFSLILKIYFGICENFKDFSWNLMHFLEFGGIFVDFEDVGISIHGGDSQNRKSDGILERFN